MRVALAESLAHIHEAAGRSVDLEEAEVARGLAEIRAHRVSPGIFGRYYEMVFALQGHRPDDASVLFREIVNLAPAPPIFSVLPFSNDALGADKERYARILSLEKESSLALTAAETNEWTRFATSVAAALRLIEQADSGLAAEFHAVVVQIIGAVPLTQNNRGFGGASSFMLWGAVLLNARLYDATLDMVAALIHEAAHQVLFGYSVHAPLVENSIEERYGSPLRTDPRPMDGIFHATFVCARMHYAYARLLQGPKNLLSQTDRQLVQQRLQEYRGKFIEGLETVKRFGRMTANGARILNAAANYMRSAA